MNSKLLFRQLFDPDTSTYTYLLADQPSGEAVIIDSVYEQSSRDLQLLADLNLKLKYILETHVHADHVTGASILRSTLGAKTAISAKAHVDCVDLPLEDGDEIHFGQSVIKCISTEGHTDTCMSYLVEDMVFTGDSLMIQSAGRTDFQSGSSAKLYESITGKLFNLPDDTKVYPAHDYSQRTHSTIREEKLTNPRVGQGKSEAEFVKIMSELKLALPHKIHEAVPANLKCGKKSNS